MLILGGSFIWSGGYICIHKYRLEGKQRAVAGVSLGEGVVIMIQGGNTNVSCSE